MQVVKSMQPTPAIPSQALRKHISPPKWSPRSGCSGMLHSEKPEFYLPVRAGGCGELLLAPAWQH